MGRGDLARPVPTMDFCARGISGSQVGEGYIASCSSHFLRALTLTLEGCLSRKPGSEPLKSRMRTGMLLLSAATFQAEPNLSRTSDMA